MKNLKEDDAFVQQVSALMDEFQQKLKTAGYELTVSKLTFSPSEEFGPCPCGIELIQDPVTGELKSRCRRCPPGQNH